MKYPNINRRLSTIPENSSELTVKRASACEFVDD